jgi:hypothetical protein
MTRANSAGDDTRAALVALLGIHTEGATAPELAVYLNRERSGVRYELGKLQQQEQVVTTPGDRNTKVWHLLHTPPPPAPTRGLSL